jgi:hypothetical protein
MLWSSLFLSVSMIIASLVLSRALERVSYAFRDLQRVFESKVAGAFMINVDQLDALKGKQQREAKTPN